MHILELSHIAIADKKSDDNLLLKSGQCRYKSIFCNCWVHVSWCEWTTVTCLIFHPTRNSVLALQLVFREPCKRKVNSKFVTNNIAQLFKNTDAKNSWFNIQRPYTLLPLSPKTSLWHYYNKGFCSVLYSLPQWSTPDHCYVTIVIAVSGK